MSSFIETLEIDKPFPIPDDKDKGLFTIKEGSHFIFSHAYQVDNDRMDPIYKHIVLTTDESKNNYKNDYKIRKIRKDIVLTSINTIMTYENQECLDVLFDHNILMTKCNNDELIDIRNNVKKMGCSGIINIWNDSILLYSENGIAKEVDYKITYNK